VLRGGVVAYATELKHRLLGVDHALLVQVGAVDPEVALQMAAGVRERLGADYGLATTGVAGPDPQDGHPPGTVHLAVCGPTAADPAASPGSPGSPVPAGVTAPTVASLSLAGDRAAVRAAAVEAALRLLLDRLRLDPAGG
jgi:nicotinamide-nucleotide amidase